MNKAFLIFSILFFVAMGSARASELGVSNGIRRDPHPHYDPKTDPDPDPNLKNLRSTFYSQKCSDRMDGTGLLGNVLVRKQDGTFVINRTFTMVGKQKLVSTVKTLNLLPKAIGESESGYHVEYVDEEKKTVNAFFVLTKEGSVSQFSVQKAGDSLIDDCPLNSAKDGVPTEVILRKCKAEHADWMTKSDWPKASVSERRYRCDKNFKHVL
jgi:hypothetical protein